MSKGRLQELRRDLLAAARTGSAEVIQTALDGLARFPPPRRRAGASLRLAPKDLRDLGLRLGDALPPQSRRGALRSLASHPAPTARAMLAWALLAGWPEPWAVELIEALLTAPEPAVQSAAREALLTLAPDERLRLSKHWGRSPELLLRSAALTLLPGAAAAADMTVLQRAADDPAPEVRAAAAEALARAAQERPEAVIQALLEWADRASAPQAWVIAKALARNPLAGRPREGLQILERLGRRHGQEPDVARALVGALRALARRGARPQVLEALEGWATAQDASLRALAERGRQRMAT